MNYEHLTGLMPNLGVQDCFTMVRAVYAENFGISITDYARPKDWDSDELDLIGLLYAREGFEKIVDWKPQSLQPGDLLALAIGARNPNHFAVFVGDNHILHHPSGRLSVVEPFREFWSKLTCFVLRHPDVPDTRPILPSTTIEELLRARYQV